jgi:hypothetical protein
MDLESAIQHLKESLADPTHKWGCEECKQEHEQLLEWLEDYKELLTVITELKRLLMFAMDSMQVMSHADGCVACSQCRYETPIGEDENGDYINSPHCDKSDCFEWKYSDKAMKLLGGADNAEN